MVNYSYVGDVNLNLICCICQAPFINPTVTATCSHTFCRDCILRSLESQQCCPVDRSSLSSDELKPENLLLRNMVDELVVECSHRPLGCKFTCQRQLLAAHLGESCQFVQVACPEATCDQTVLRRDLGLHAHDCVHRVIKCDACGMSVRTFDFEAHNSECAEQETTCSACTQTLRRADLTKHRSQCEEVQLTCLHITNGCPWNGARKALDPHLSNCPYEAIKGFFTLNDARLSALHDENTVMRRKIKNAEATIQSLRRDLDIARKALGPWWKLDDTLSRSHEELTDPSTSTQQAQRSPEQSRWRMLNPLPPNLTFSPDSSPALTTHETDPFANAGPSFSDPGSFSYFPAVPSAIQTDAPSTPAYSGASPPAPSDTLARHHFPFSSRGAAAFPPPPVRFLDLPHAQSQMLPRARIAPVDRDATLEGALHGLRGSSVVLSGALDALARRTDVALTTENLRMNEEVGALRAIVHGLRMQVHALITERNGGSPWGPAATTASPYYGHSSSPPHPPLMINPTTQITKL
ncbi:hypothetical protein M0805_000506 [Coniferiporia weirii]|nr:hypothetical protein M0805_000506 [Coniferiporia weirii]